MNAWMGSSPHARGALTEPGAVKKGEGIIPACAGSTISTARSNRFIRDHPRMRGEHRGYALTLGKTTGSSPHARGAPLRRSTRPPTKGIIPACAGSTLQGHWQSCQGWDHPRMRGEHGDSSDSIEEATGSSPHARGAHFTTSASGQHSRLIHSLFASSSHPSGLSSDYIFARRNTCWHCSNPWKAHRQVSRHQCRSVGE